MRTCSQKNIEENLRRTEAGFHPECEPTDIDAQSPLAFNLKTGINQGKYPPAEPGALGIGPLEAATLDPKLYLFGRRTKYSLPTSPRPFIQIFLRHFGEQMPLDNCVATWWG